MRKTLILLLITNLFVMTSCTWVHLTPQGENIRTVNESETAGCKKLGETTVSVLAKIAGIKRNREKIRTELRTLGRNSAAEMGGDTIVPVSEIKNGEQTFAVYECINP